jgi:hypothetical protein
METKHKGGGIMPKRLKFFAVFAVLVLFSFGLAKDYMDNHKMGVDFEFDGQMRYRYEYWQQHPFLWNGGAFPGLSFLFFDPFLFNHNYTNFHSLRSRFGVKATLDEDKFAYIQFQDARLFGQDVATFGYDAPWGTPDMHNYAAADLFGVTQAYFQVNNLWESNFGLKVGRQFLQYDAEKLIGDDDWSLFSQSFDALKLMYRYEYFDADLFYSQLWPAYPVDDLFGNINFFGLHGTAKYTPNHKWSAYVYGYRDGNLRDPGGFGSLQLDPYENPDVSPGFPPEVADTTTTLLWTLGTRAKGSLPFGLGYAGEFSYQFGHWYQTDVSAFMFEADLWYKFEDAASKPYFGLGFTYASGDDTADVDKKTFVRLFPSPHRHAGYMDLVGLQNLMNLEVKAGIQPTPRVGLHAAPLVLQCQAEISSVHLARFGPLRLSETSLTLPSNTSMTAACTLKAAGRTSLPAQPWKAWTMEPEAQLMWKTSTGYTSRPL